MLPPAQYLIDKIKPEESAIVDGWQCGFSPDLTSWVPPKPNTKSPLELLTGFYHFYSHFDYENSVISPNCGETHDKAVTFAFTTSKIAVQDPFELDHCITKGFNNIALEG